MVHAAKSYLVLVNIAKRSNFGNLIRMANAMGAAEVVIVGRRAFREFGAFGTTRGIRKRHFYTLDEACEYLRDVGCSIVGVELTDDAAPITTHPFHGTTAFMVGNEGDGLNAHQLAGCDTCVYIPQYGTAASLNVNVATAIVLHPFATWAGFTENERRRSKCVPAEEPANHTIT